VVRVAINGFGRIGRLVFRAAWQNPGIEIVAVNDLSAVATNAHLLKYDSTHGTFAEEVSAKEGCMEVSGRKVAAFSQKELHLLPWKKLGVDVVIEATGRFNDALLAAGHREAGARKVLITAPGKNADATIVMGVNQGVYDQEKHHVISNASCTTNALAPVAKVLDDNFGIVSGLMTTVHAYTNDQQLLDQGHRDLRRARAAASSIIPTTTGAAQAVGLVLPNLQGKLNGFSLRVPTANVSVIDLTAELEREANAAEINKALAAAAAGEFRGILGYSDLPLVSVDYNGSGFSSVVDGLSTMVCGRLAKVISWYDNEWGYSQRVIDLLKHISASL